MLLSEFYAENLMDDETKQPSAPSLSLPLSLARTPTLSSSARLPTAIPTLLSTRVAAGSSTLGPPVATIMLVLDTSSSSLCGASATATRAGVTPMIWLTKATGGASTTALQGGNPCGDHYVRYYNKQLAGFEGYVGGK
ncbi:hypothetical protein Moror_5132 [Moniliophthora roreri MCA 2997]|uniref:Uncharacterized protein n=1 Tax=Moniliophthora roreri (strain MCA 2997) TaxID=1381753 RepID=V2X647_MONRO|nr:hypothetical protein Moror_5132 [Moniliophthora roreri MCA 2997]